MGPASTRVLVALLCLCLCPVASTTNYRCHEKIEQELEASFSPSKHGRMQDVWGCNRCLNAMVEGKQVMRDGTGGSAWSAWGPGPVSATAALALYPAFIRLVMQHAVIYPA